MSTVDTLLIHANIASFNQAISNESYGTLEDTCIGITSGKITWIGHEKDVPNAKKTFDCKGKWITPGLIDCHTHIVYGGNRSNEFEARLKGVSYTDIAKQGGGILSTVRATREIDEAELYRYSAKRLETLLAEGITTVEIKSGYGLNLATEEKMLVVAKQLGEDYGITVKKTYLAAHALPQEFKGNKEGYVDKVCEWLPILHAKGLVDAVDGFIEEIAFDNAQITRIFEVAKSLNIPVKLHAEQITNLGGSQLVAKYRGLSSDHIEQLNEDGVRAMAEANTVGVLLPGAFYTLKDETVPPIHLLRQYGVPMAVSTDCNPGTSPVTSLLLMMNMACTLFGLTPEEALAGTTKHAAQALGLSNQKGQIAIGFDADLAIWDIDRPADLCYLLGFNSLEKVMCSGQWRD